MSKYKVFVSGNQKEFKNERIAIKKFIENELGPDIFEVFIFEDTPADGFSPNQIYLGEVKNSDIFIGLIGNIYGNIHEDGISASEKEFDTFRETNNSANTYMFILDNINPDENTKKFINKAHKVTYKKFNNLDILLKEIKNSLSNFLLNIKKQSDIEFDEKLNMNANIEDISLEEINNFLKRTSHETIEKEDIENFLKNNAKVLGEYNNQTKIMNAGILFFTNNPSEFISQHEIKVARFQGTDKVNIIDNEDMKYPILKLIAEVEKFVKKQTNTYQRIEGFNRIDITQYPMEAIREGIINAIAHRNYEIKHSSISVFIFKDRIEITSPGNLIPPVTLKSIKSMENYYSHRNEKICELFRRVKLMEQYGTGIPKMNSIMEKNGLEKPEFIEDEYLFKIVFRGHDPDSTEIFEIKNEGTNLKDLGLNERQINALTLIINNNEFFSTKTYSERFDVSIRTARRDLNKLSEEGYISKYYPQNKKSGVFGKHQDDEN